MLMELMWIEKATCNGLGSWVSNFILRVCERKERMRWGRLLLSIFNKLWDHLLIQELLVLIILFVTTLRLKLTRWGRSIHDGPMWEILLTITIYRLFIRRILDVAHSGGGAYFTNPTDFVSNIIVITRGLVLLPISIDIWNQALHPMSLLVRALLLLYLNLHERVWMILVEVSGAERHRGFFEDVLLVF